MVSGRIERIERNFNLLQKNCDSLVRTFYEMMFEKYPNLQSLFPDDINRQYDKLISALAFVVGNMRYPDNLKTPLKELGIRHLDYGVTPNQFPCACDIMLQAIAHESGTAWNSTLEEDWSWALQIVSYMMLSGIDDACDCDADVVPVDVSF